MRAIAAAHTSPLVTTYHTAMEASAAAAFWSQIMDWTDKEGFEQQHSSYSIARLIAAIEWEAV